MGWCDPQNSEFPRSEDPRLRKPLKRIAEAAKNLKSLGANRNHFSKRDDHKSYMQSLKSTMNLATSFDPASFGRAFFGSPMVEKDASGAVTTPGFQSSNEKVTSLIPDRDPSSSAGLRKRKAIEGRSCNKRRKTEEASYTLISGEENDAEENEVAFHDISLDEDPNKPRRSKRLRAKRPVAAFGGFLPPRTSPGSRTHRRAINKKNKRKKGTKKSRGGPSSKVVGRGRH